MYKPDRSKIIQLLETDHDNVDLSNMDLSGLDLSGFHMDNVNFYWSLLQGTNLTGASLVGANFANCDLAEANLTNARLMYANFDCAILEGANLSGANLQFSSVRETSLGNAKYDKNTVWPVPRDMLLAMWGTKDLESLRAMELCTFKLLLAKYLQNQTVLEDDVIEFEGKRYVLSRIDF
jgi:hypothetical protein